MNVLRRRPVLFGLVGGALGLWTYDTYWMHERFNRSVRALGSAAYTIYQYKYVLERYPDKLFEVHGNVAQRWFDLCSRNGGLYIKLGQGVATMNHVLPAEYVRLFSNLWDQAPSIEYSEVRKVIREDFGKELEEIYSEFNTEPVASASIAQVHHARLKDGTPVAVKVQKPAIACQMAWDLALYKFLVYAFDKLFELPMYWTGGFASHCADAAVEHTCEHLTREANFHREALNTLQAKVDLEKYLPDIYVPRIFHNFISQRVLTMEWIDGLRISEPEAVAAAGFSVKKVMETMVTAFSHQIFVSGFLHVDPHPGNVMVRRKPGSSEHQVVILDHGLYVTESEAFRLAYCRLWRAMLLMDIPTVSAVCKSWGINDFELFASFQLFRPFRKDMQNVHLEKVSRKDMLGMQTEAKERVRAMLENTAKIPQELLLVGRCMNILRSNNKRMGSIVNRIAIMADKAAEGYRFNQQASVMSSTGGLYASWDRANFRKKVSQWLYGAGMGFEDVMDRNIQDAVTKKFGVALGEPNVG